MNEAIWMLAGAAGGGLAATGVAYWVTRRALARVRQAEGRARAAERLADVGAMTGGLAHEIKNPLSTIGLNAQLLEEGLNELEGADASDPEVRRRLMRRVGVLRREVDRLRGILTDFLEFAGELRLAPASADLNQIVTELVDFFTPQAERLGVRVRCDLEPGRLNARLDAAHVKQAALNLMLNACQAMAPAPDVSSGPVPPRGELILKTQRGADALKRSTVVLHVIDTGPGIPAEVMPKVFKPYFTTKSGGTGLGLPTTRRIVEAHQGTVSIHSEPGRGTDVVLTFPAESK